MTPKQIEEMRAKSREGDGPRYDMVRRPPKAEKQINETVRASLSGPSGQALMDYIKSITINFVVPPSATDAELRHHEGMRHLAQILDMRLKASTK